MKKAVIAALFLSLVPMACFAQQWDRDPNGEARHINELAAADKIRTEQDARNYVDALARAFGDHYGWFTRSIRHQLARQEYKAVREGQLVNDERLATAVNDVLDATGAPAWSRMNATEIRNYRDANLAFVNLEHVPIHLWHMPNVVARSASGGFAEDSRPVEALMLLYLLTSLPENLISTKDRARNGQLASVLIEEEHKKRSASQVAVPRTTLVIEGAQDPRVSEFYAAQQRYLQSHSSADIDRNIFEAAKRLICSDSK